MARARKTPRDDQGGDENPEETGGVSVGATEGGDPTPETAPEAQPGSTAADKAAPDDEDESVETIDAVMLAEGGIEAPLSNDAQAPDDLGGASGGGAFGGFSASVFADAPREEPGGGAPDKGARKRAKPANGEKITPDQRAKIAVIGGEFVGGGLDMLAGVFGSKLTIEEFSGRMNARFAERMKARGIDLPVGMPLDIREPSAGELPVVQTLSIVMRFDGHQFVPVRFAAGRTQLADDEGACANAEAPREGEHVVAEIPANAAHAIMYNLAAKPHEFAIKALAWLRENEESLRVGYAGLLTFAFMWQALNTKEK